MKLGPRIAIATALIMGTAMGLSVVALVSLRRADLETDLRSRSVELARVVAAGLEPLRPDNARAVLDARRDLLAASLPGYELERIFVQPERPTDPGWAQLIEAATIHQAPVGRIFAPDDRDPFFAMAIPLHDATADDPVRDVVAVLGLRRDTQDIERAIRDSLRSMLPFILVGVALFGVLVYLLLRSGVVRPLRRLNDAIDAVAAGDLSRALLPQRDDEVGVLAAHFNDMTTSLREAQEAQARATAARSTLQMRLRHSERLATMGQMAAQIAHELGTPLAVIGGRARSLDKRATDPVEVRKNVEIIQAQVERITRIIKQVLSFSRKSRPTLTRVDVGVVMREALGYVDENLREQGVTVVITDEAGVPEIPGDPGEIQQVFLNLINNSLQAMPHGGQMEVRLTTVTRRKEGLALADPAPYVLVEVMDTGPGVPESDRDRIFEPFFTTKDGDGGTGLGLAVSKGIVTDHDGWLEVGDRSEPGACFRVFLPVTAEPGSSDALPVMADTGP